MSRTRALFPLVLSVVLVGAPPTVGAEQGTGDTMQKKAGRATDRIERAAEQAGDKIDRGARRTREEVGRQARGTADATEHQSRDVATAIKDSWITAKTQIALFADDRVKGTQVEVDTSNAVVTLRGKVDSAEAKQSAAEIARGIDGVQSVRNQLQVVAPSRQDAVEVRDADVTKAVEERLARSPRLGDVDVETNAGVVTLKGEAPSLNHSARASQLARDVAGVTAVKNEIAVDRDWGAASDRSRSGRDKRSAAMSADRADGMTGSKRVHHVQEALKERGHDPGPVDGIMGPQTRAALEEFQKVEDLTATGLLDRETASRLRLETPPPRQ